MRYITYIILFIAGGMMTACHPQSDRLKAVLKYSGTNRAELEKVLEHYSQNPADSLKLQSAIFLIENMPGHYTYSGPFLNEYYARIDTVRNTPYHEKKLFQMLPFSRTEYRNGLEIREDVKHIKADFLIHNIELAFRQWETLPWLESVDFHTFREYLLPYRVENEPLDSWRDSISFFRERLLDYTDHYEDCRYSVTYMKNKFYSYIFNAKQKIPEINLKNFEMECIPISKLNLFANRIIGIPSAIDYIPHFANRNGRHYWAIGIDCKLNPFQVFQANIYRAPKIYRRTFSHNPTPQPKGKEYIPSFFRDPFNKDVTGLYIPTADITIDVPRNIKTGHAYLAVFNDLTWKPVACAEVSGRQARFHNMGKDIVYLPVYYDEEEEMHPITSPFIVFSNGEIRYLNSAGDIVQKMVLTRKYPNGSERDYWFNELIGARFEASNQADFKQADTLFFITQRPTGRYQYITPDSLLKRRYWRFVNSTNKVCHLADLHFYTNEQTPIRGRVMEVDSIRARAILDDTPLTFGTIYTWIGMDFGKPVSISQIRYLPRNDANGIFPGNEYELFYYQFPEGWKSLGIKTPDECEVEYNQIPAGTLYWLRNHTAGQEERIFTWENGKARFW